MDQGSRFSPDIAVSAAAIFHRLFARHAAPLGDIHSTHCCMATPRLIHTRMVLVGVSGFFLTCRQSERDICAPLLCALIGRHPRTHPLVLRLATSLPTSSRFISLRPSLPLFITLHPSSSTCCSHFTALTPLQYFRMPPAPPETSVTSKTPTPAETPRCVLVSKRGGQGAEFHICHGNHAQPALHYEYEDDATHTGAYLIDGDSHTPINIAKAADDKEVELPPPTRSPESSAPSTSEQQAEKTAAAHSDSDDDGDTGKREGLVPKRSEAGVLHEEPVQETMRQLQAQITELTSLLNALRADDVEEVKKSTPQVLSLIHI